MPELNEIKSGVHRLEGRVDDISSRIGDTNLQTVELGRRIDEAKTGWKVRLWPDSFNLNLLTAPCSF